MNMLLISKFSWLDLNNEEQVKWAISYLIRTGHITGYIQDFNFTVLQDFFKKITNSYTDDKIELLVRKMKTAWSQKKTRSHVRGKKAYSFIMHTSIGDILKRLSGKSPVNQTLEELIKDANAFKQALRKEHDEQMSKNRAALNSSFTGSKKSNAEISKLKAIKKAEERLILNLIFDKLKYEMLLQKADIDKDSVLSTEDQTLINQKRKDLIDYYKREIESALGIDAFHAVLATGDIDILGINNYRFPKNDSSQ